MTNLTVACWATPDSYCSRTDALVDLDGVHVIAVARSGAKVTLTVETPWERQRYRRCGVVALSHGRRTRLLRDVPCSGSAVVLRWRQRTWARPDDGCPVGTFTEELPSLASRRAVLTTRASGHARDPLYRIRNILHRGIEHLTPRQGDRLDECLADGDPDGEVQVAWRCYQQLRATYRAKDTAEGKRSAEGILETFHTCPIPEIARLGRTLRRWKKEFLDYFTTDRANNGGTEAINGIIELHRRITRGYRNGDHYRLRMLLVASGLLLPPQL